MAGMPDSGRIWQGVIYLRSSFWFVPACMLLGAVALALGLIEVGRGVDEELRKGWPRMFASEAEGSRAMLAAIATSMITVAGVVFSITIVALAQAATQYTSRVLRNFMRDRLNQVVLGVFVGVFTYCLIVLRSIRQNGSDPFVPVLAVFVALLLAIVAIGFLIAFIHHISSTLQAGEIARGVMADTQRTLDRMFPDSLADTDVGGCDSPRDSDGGSWQIVTANETGYIQSVSVHALLNFAIRHDTVVCMEVGVGDFIAGGRPIARLEQARPVSEAQRRTLNRLYAVGPYRTTDRDPAYGFRQLVDIALKALSPGINDTTTAGTCIDYLSVLLERMAARKMELPHQWEGVRSRVIGRGTSFAELVGLSFAQILENAVSNTAIVVRLLHMAEEVAVATRSPARLRLLAEWVSVIEEVAVPSAVSNNARQRIALQIGRARRACDATDPKWL